MSSFDMETRKGDKGIFDVLLGWADGLRARGLYPYGLEEQITALERVLQDIEDKQVEKQATRKLSFWYDLVRRADPDKSRDPDDFDEDDFDEEDFDEEDFDEEDFDEEDESVEATPIEGTEEGGPASDTEVGPNSPTGTFTSDEHRTEITPPPLEPTGSSTQMQPPSGELQEIPSPSDAASRVPESQPTLDEAIQAFRVNSLQMLEILSSWEGPSSRDATLKELKGLGAEPPADWSSGRTGGRHSSGHPEYSPDVWKQLFRAMQNAGSLEHVERQIRLLYDLYHGRSLGALETRTMLELVHQMLRADPREPEATSFEPVDPPSKGGDDPRKRAIAGAKYLWTIEIRFLSDKPKCDGVGYLIWTFGAALEQIPGVIVDVDSWGEGSLWVKLRVFIANLWARDDVQVALSKSRDAVIARYLDQPVEQNEKTQAEKEKLHAERAAILKQIESMPSAQDADVSRLHELRHQELVLRKEEAEIEGKEIENRLRKLELFEKVSKLIADGIVQADKVQIDMNGLMFLLFDGKEAIKGHHFKLIEDSESVLKEDDDREAPSEA